MPLGKSLLSVSAHEHLRVAELARPRAAKQTRAMKYPSSFATVELQQLCVSGPRLGSF